LEEEDMPFVAALTAAALIDAQTGSLQAAAQAFDDAQLRHDRRAIESFLAPDFQYVARKGQLLGRDAFIANTTTPGETLEPFVVSDHRVLALGADGGVASGDATVRGALNGAVFTDRFRYADVFARRNGRWVVVYTQVTALPPGGEGQ
jgi:hypothetical protein